jgi:potassium efflux system protein
MNIRAIRVAGFLLVLITALMVMRGPASAQAPKASQSSSEEKKETSSAVSLPEFAPLATQLAERSAALKNKLEDVFDISKAEEVLPGIAERTEKLSEQFAALKKTGNYSYDQIAALEAAIDIEAHSLKKTTQSLTEAVNQTNLWKEEWLSERQKWKDFRSSISKDVPLRTVEPIFTKANNTINSTLKLITEKLKSLLALQQSTGEIQSGLYSLALEVDNILSFMRGEIWRKSDYSMFSSEYYSQFGAGQWEGLREGLSKVSWPGRGFFQKQGWLLVLQFFLSLGLILAILRNRSFLDKDERWQFIAKRPLAAGIFVGFFSLVMFYKTPPPTWRLTMNFIMTIALARLLGGFISNLWKRRLVYALAVTLIATQVFQTLGVPLPLFRVYVFITATVAMCLCIWGGAESSRRKGSILYIWALRMGALSLLGVIIAEVGGYSVLAAYLLKSSLTTTFAVLAAWMLMLMARSTLEWIIQSPPLRKIPFLQSKANLIVSRSVLLTNVLIASLFATFILVIWRVYDSPAEAIQGVFGFGFMVGSRKVTLGLILTAAAFLYGSFLISWAVQILLMKGVFTRREMQVGVRISIARLIHYGFVFVGFLLALVALGVHLRDVTIIAGALGVGIGFGLQGIVNNFVSGLILLFERPIKVGDYIQLSEQWAEIKKIGLRATVVETFDRSEIVVPNSDLISNQVTNWTLSNRIARIIIPVGVEYGSDVPLVMKTLMESAMASSKVLRMPEPQVLFLRFGGSSLDFELRVWISDIDDRLVVMSQMHQEIDQRFRQAGIVIAFPQVDLHVRSVEESPGSVIKPHKDRRPDLTVLPRKERDEEDVKDE